MFIKEGRIFCMENIRQYMLVGTSKGYVIVFNADTKTRHNVIPFDDAILSLKVLPDRMHIVVGLASGDLYVATTKELLNGGKNFSSTFYTNCFQNKIFLHFSIHVSLIADF